MYVKLTNWSQTYSATRLKWTFWDQKKLSTLYEVQFNHFDQNQGKYQENVKWTSFCFNGLFPFEKTRENVRGVCSFCVDVD